MNTRNTPAALGAHHVITTRRTPWPLASLRRWWLRLRIRWTQEEIDARAADGLLSPAQHALWRECITNWRRELRGLN